eukprot:TRINITY_DN8889_c3_g2_i1.p1 TRINITY_DN8889_c3_g2~~TRINITY_DN8889_c3_g2_i1.p1  ORF type:complete len:529 (+),score=133.49 TRINITY_DN8889_c3_g2_i1:96-1682(+)
MAPGRAAMRGARRAAGAAPPPPPGAGRRPRTPPGAPGAPAAALFRRGTQRRWTSARRGPPAGLPGAPARYCSSPAAACTATAYTLDPRQGIEACIGGVSAAVKDPSEPTSFALLLISAYLHEHATAGADGGDAVAEVMRTVQQRLAAPGRPPPPVLGAVVPGLVWPSSLSRHQYAEGDRNADSTQAPGCSLSVYKLGGGVRAVPFRVDSCRLPVGPGLEPTDWIRMHHEARSDARARSMVVMLSDTAFGQSSAQGVLGKVHNMIPSAVVTGGLVQPGKPLLLGGDVYAGGAVGLVVHGTGWQAEPLCVQCGRGVGPQMQITKIVKATDKRTGKEMHLITRLDGQTVRKRLVDVLALRPHTKDGRGVPLAVGYYAPGTSTPVTRHFQFKVAAGEVEVLFVHGVEPEEGGRVQLQVLDPSYGCQSLHVALEKAQLGAAPGVRAEPPSIAESPICSSEPADTGALVFACVGTARKEGDAFDERRPSVGVAGAYMLGEFGAAEAGARPYALGYTSSCALFKRAQPVPATGAV